jgi:hypothetical protein
VKVQSDRPQAGSVAEVGRLVFSGQLINCYIRLRTAGSGIRRRPLVGLVVECRVKTLTIITEFDVPGNILSGVFPGRVNGAVDPFYFHGSVE